MDQISIADAVGELRRQILAAQNATRDGDIAFRITEAELQLQGSFSREETGEANGKLSFSLFGLGVEGGGSASTGQAHETVQTVTLKLDVRQASTGQSVDINATFGGPVGTPGSGG